MASATFERTSQLLAIGTLEGYIFGFASNNTKLAELAEDESNKCMNSDSLRRLQPPSESTNDPRQNLHSSQEQNFPSESSDDQRQTSLSPIEQNFTVVVSKYPVVCVSLSSEKALMVAASVDGHLYIYKPPKIDLRYENGRISTSTSWQFVVQCSIGHSPIAAAFSPLSLIADLGGEIDASRRPRQQSNLNAVVREPPRSELLCGISCEGFIKIWKSKDLPDSPTRTSEQEKRDSDERGQSSNKLGSTQRIRTEGDKNGANRGENLAEMCWAVEVNSDLEPRPGPVPMPMPTPSQTVVGDDHNLSEVETCRVKQTGMPNGANELAFSQQENDIIQVSAREQKLDIQSSDIYKEAQEGIPSLRDSRDNHSTNSNRRRKLTARLRPLGDAEQDHISESGLRNGDGIPVNHIPSKYESPALLSHHQQCTRIQKRLEDTMQPMDVNESREVESKIDVTAAAIVNVPNGEKIFTALTPITISDSDLAAAAKARKWTKRTRQPNNALDKKEVVNSTEVRILEYETKIFL
jgi:hypothetical protein